MKALSNAIGHKFNRMCCFPEATLMLDGPQWKCFLMSAGISSTSLIKKKPHMQEKVMKFNL